MPLAERRETHLFGRVSLVQFARDYQVISSGLVLSKEDIILRVVLYLLIFLAKKRDTQYEHRRGFTRTKVVL